MKKIALPVLVLAAALAGCATGGGTVTPMSTSSTPAAAPAAESKPDGTAAHPATWGQEYKGASLSVGVTAPAPYTPSRNAFSSKKIERAVSLEVTVTNNSKDQPIPAMAINIQGTSGGTQAEKIFDSEGTSDFPTADIVPGKSLSWKVTFSIPKDSTELAVQVSSLGGGKTIYFSGKL